MSPIDPDLLDLLLRALVRIAVTVIEEWLRLPR